MHGGDNNDNGEGDMVGDRQGVPNHQGMETPCETFISYILFSF